MPNIIPALKINAAHGIKGDVKVFLYVEDVDLLRHIKNFTTKDGKIFTLKSIKPGEKIVTAAFEGVTDRNMAEALRGTELFMPKHALPEIEDEDEFYIDDLIGLKVRLQDGTDFGTIRTVWNFGAGDILEIEKLDGGELLLPFRLEFVPEIDVEAGVVVIVEPKYI